MDATAEAAVMTYVREHGYPVPVVHRAAGRELEMQRLDGPTLMQTMAAGELSVKVGAKILADLHSMLHEMPTPRGTAPSARVVHLDLHPENVLLTERGPMVIDWTNAAYGSRDLDLAVTAVIMAEVAADPSHDHRALAGTVLEHFLRFARGFPLRELEAAVARRRADRGLTPEEKDRLPEAEALIRSRSS
jgi:Ser/Thr protein kinase RdoA (MazF antagonist)